jgi:hypothetical protein
VSLESAPFEVLFRRYTKADANEKRNIYAEFCRRVGTLVHQAAQDYAKRRASEDVDALVNRVFRAFVPQIGAGEPEFGLRRFASTVRSELDDEAFECIAHRLYYQLPLYHIANDEERRFLAAMFQQGLLAGGGVSHIQELSERLQVSPEHAERVVRCGWKRLDLVVAKDFDEQELNDFTEGYVVKKGSP